MQLPHLFPFRSAAAAAAMVSKRRRTENFKIDWQKIFGCAIPDPEDRDSGAAARAGPDDEKRSGTLRRNRRFETRSSELYGRVGESSSDALFKIDWQKLFGCAIPDPEDRDSGAAARAGPDEKRSGTLRRCRRFETRSSELYGRVGERSSDALLDCGARRLVTHLTAEVQNVVPLDNEEATCEMPDRWNEPNIYCPSRDDLIDAQIDSSNIECLQPEQYLSSPVISCCIQNIKRNHIEDFRDKFYIFGTHFYEKLEGIVYGQDDFPKLRRWWKGVDLFDRAYIILPIFGKEHWSLIIICMPAKESVSGPIVLHLDSLKLHPSTKIFNTVRRFIELECHHFKNNPSPNTPVSETTLAVLSSIIEKAVEVPQQNNQYDCGIFMLYYIERFISEAPERFTEDKLGMFSQNWFKPEDASELRQTIRQGFSKVLLDNSTMAAKVGKIGKSASEEECGKSGDAGKSKGTKVHSFGDNESGGPSPVVVSDGSGGDPSRRPQRVIIERSDNMARKEKELQCALDVTVTGSCLEQVELIAKVKAEISQTFHILERDLVLRRTAPTNFLLSLPNLPLVEKVYNDGKPMVSTSMQLQFSRWTPRLLPCTEGVLPVAVEVELRGIPDHAWELMTVMQLLNDYCGGCELNPDTDNQQDVFRITAWCSRPELIPPEMILEIVEAPLPVGDGGALAGKRTLKYKIGIIVKRRMTL